MWEPSCRFALRDAVRTHPSSLSLKAVVRSAMAMGSATTTRTATATRDGPPRFATSRGGEGAWTVALHHQKALQQ